MKYKFLTFATMLLTLIFSATALAAIPGINNNRYIKMYGLSSANNTPVFTDARFNQRGTATPFQAYNATIYANDEIWVFAMNDSVALISYPTSSGRRQGYVRTSDLTSNNYSRGSQKARANLNNIYLRPGVRYSNSSIDAGDDVWTVARQGNYTQVVYPAGNVYKMAWITNSDYDNYIATSTPTINYARPAEGDYYIVPENSGAHAIDVPNNSHNEGTVLHIYSKNDSAAQIFTVRRVNNEWYKIIHKDSGYVINCYGGGNQNGNRLWLYRDDGTASCYWRFRDLGNGVYNIESQLPTNPYLEVQNNNSFNGAVLQLWQQHSGQAAKWRLVSANNPPPPPTRDFPNSVYLRQVGNNTCTLSASAMMLRAKAYLNGRNDWSAITEPAIRSTAWTTDGLRWSWSYANMNVSHEGVSGISASSLQSLINQHPEGIVIHCKSIPHAVWVNSYDGNNFYCGDPLGQYSERKIALKDSYLGRKFGNQSNILANVTAYWYIR